MWTRAAMYYPIGPVEPVPKLAVTRDTLSEALHAAIDKNSIENARSALEEAFWRKIDFTPDVFHLCRALAKQDRELVKLLATYGAKPQEHESSAAYLFISGKGIDTEPLLRGTGITLLPPTTSTPQQHIDLSREIEAMVTRKSLKDSFDKIGLGKKTRDILAATAGIELNAKQTQIVLDDLARSLKDDIVSVDITAAVSLLKQTKANFTSIDPNKYLGKRGPGLAKTLLDAGIVSAEAFDMRTLVKRVGGEIKIFTLPEDKNFAYTEFLCQVSLEIADPKRFVPLRDDADEKNQYQKHFRDKWVKASTPDLTYRLKGPNSPK